ncbi:diaminopimelate decarboxylase [Neomegalonema sp.]|uniref:diaminopimelate decarboxylase n=1 Tax=Neomegalonema sp. TaxID=2039713 RepID=UPI00261B3EB2|nr:diaminopimelate decarboxylase [Neomegalonema sp.]MDD2866950.1 diaminopimelate decarboxylase [Neomegalonema sp.]
MDHFLYKNGALHAEDVPLAEIAEAVGTPVYVYSRATLERHYRVFDEALESFPKRIVCFAVKANGSLAVLATMAKLGAGADVVSEGEFRRALAAGVPGEKVIFSGVGKTPDEMRFALEQGVRQFNVESEPELEALNAVAIQRGVRAPVALRMNPDVDAKTHAKISTGKSENKFGVPAAQIAEVVHRALQMPGIRLTGLAMHIGSQLTDLEPFAAAFARMRRMAEDLRAEGIALERLDLGGGLGVPYERRTNAPPPLPLDYGRVAEAALGDFVRETGAELALEPGRLIAANAGILLSRVVYVKQGEGRRFLILDSAMNDLMRPAMYDAWHDLVPVKEAPLDAPTGPYDVVGPVCETGDRFAEQRPLPPLVAGDLVAFRTAGAYGASMASEYNTRPLVPEVLVDGERFAVTRPRPTYDEILSRDRIPDWL